MTTPVKELNRRAHQALEDETLKKALSVIADGFVNKRAKAVADCPGFQDLSDQAVAMKNHTLAHLPDYLAMFDEAVSRTGGKVHYAKTADEARALITKICNESGAKRIAKGKSMVGEEIDLREHLAEEGFDCIETDLGEYLIQLREEKPSHIIAPAVHLTRAHIRDDFIKAHKSLDAGRPLERPEDFVAEARQVLRAAFLGADVGITGANALIAETGSAALVTNEGNGDLVASLPKTHIIISSFDKLVPTFEDACLVLRLLARSATGQPISTYTSFHTGTRKPGEQTGPDNFHIVLLDNGRSQMLGSNFQEMLRCIRCGACLNHCPVYQNIGGHAYGSVYPGPMGAVLSPQFLGQKASGLPFASSFCGRCNEVCPMQIPLTKLMRQWREAAAKDSPLRERLAIKLWAFAARRPRLYGFAARAALPLISRLSNHQPVAKRLPLLQNWCRHRTAPPVARSSFQAQYAKRLAASGRGNGKGKDTAEEALS